MYLLTSAQRTYKITLYVTLYENRIVRARNVRCVGQGPHSAHELTPPPKKIVHAR